MPVQFVGVMVESQRNTRYLIISSKISQTFNFLTTLSSLLASELSDSSTQKRKGNQISCEKTTTAVKMETARGFSADTAIGNHRVAQKNWPQN